MYNGILDIFSSSFGSLLGGFLTALVIAGALLVYSAQYAKRGSISPAALIICGVLFCILFYQTTLMYGAIGSKSVALKFISALHLQFGDNINGAELQERMTVLIRENPLISFFIDYGDLEDFDWSEPIKSLRSVVAREYNWYIFRRVVWSVVYTAIAFIGILLTSNQKKSRRHKYNFDYDDNFGSSSDYDDYNF